MNRPATASTRSKEPHFSKRILVTIKRDMTAATPRIIFSHEYPLLELIHGDGTVTELDPAVLDDGYSVKASAAMLVHNKVQDKVLPPSQTNGIGFLFIGDADAEYQRLSEAYGFNEGGPIVEQVYGRAQTGQLRRLLSTPRLADLPPAQLLQVLKEHGFVPTRATPSMTDAEKTEANEAYAAFMKLSHDDLLKIAEEGGIELG